MRIGLILALLLSPSITRSSEKPAASEPRSGVVERLNEALLEQFKWRELGPANMGGRINDIAVVDAKPQHYIIGVATGGVWKTVNNGTTWTPIFDAYGTASIGDVDLCQTNPDLIWVGTGEANARNSVTPGDGVYKSTDGGKTFANMGLRGTRHIGRVVIHPNDPDTVYVAALGGIYKPSKERGLYRTRDGGKSWKCIKFIDEDTGFIDLILEPGNPDTMYAAAYAVRRDAFSGSNSPTLHKEGAGIYKSLDGGETWVKLVKGLPAGPFGRIGLDIYRKDPRVIFAIVETKTTTAMDTTPGASSNYMGIGGEDADGGPMVTSVVKDGPAEKAGLQVGDIVKEFGGKPITQWSDLVVEIRSRKPGDKVQIKVMRGSEEKVLEVTIARRPSEWMPGTVSLDPPQDPKPQDPAEKGGVFRSDDGGETWTHCSALNPRPFYFSQIRVDPLNDQRVWVLGVQLHYSEDGGKKFKDVGRGVHSDHHAMWINPRDSDHVLDGTDGGLYVTYDRAKTWEHLSNVALGQYYAVGLDLSKPYRVFGGLQDNGTWWGPSRSRNPAIVNDDFSFILGGDGFYARVDPTDPNTVYCESQYGMTVRMDLKTRSTRSIRPPGNGLRFEWNTPIELSPIEPQTVYIGANKLFESKNRGDGMAAISGDLCKTDRGSITTIAPSALDANVIWVGTNDGGVHVTKDRGKTWSDVTANVKDLPPLLWVTRVEASRASAGRAYLTVDGRRKDDLNTYVYRTDDYGATWTRMADGLPSSEPAYVIREHPRHSGLLFVGTERGVYVTADGNRFVSLQRNLPVVPVHDLAIHPRDGDIVAATHGRSMWAMDIRPLEELTVAVLDNSAHLFDPGTAVRWKPGKQGWFGGTKGFKGTNPPSGATISYYLRDDAKNVTLAVLDAKGRQVTRLASTTKRGLHRVNWSWARGGRGGGGGSAAAGEYMIVLSVDGLSQARGLIVEDDAGE